MTRGISTRTLSILNIRRKCEKKFTIRAYTQKNILELLLSLCKWKRDFKQSFKNCSFPLIPHRQRNSKVVVWHWSTQVSPHFGQNKFCDACLLLRMPFVAIAIASDSIDISKKRGAGYWQFTVFTALCSTDFSPEPVDRILRISIAQLAMDSEPLLYWVPSLYQETGLYSRP